ncbi:hypothetical protein EU538_04705 [Candidatus Thorarchaeota archaeon]|nr:MAG: hypothetical protein EU538_04705 [Candidatus Thorarchaeota archaeon]
MEVEVDGYVIDIVRNDLLIEIQTTNFSAIKGKLWDLLQRHRVRLVYPVIAEKHIIKETPDGSKVIDRRLSPKRESIHDVFYEMVYLPRFIERPNFSIHVVVVKAEEIRRRDGRGSWRRRGWSIIDTELVEVIDSQLFEKPSDLVRLIPGDLDCPFTNSELAEYIGRPAALARKMTYTLRKLGVLRLVGKRGRAHLHSTD